MMKFNLLITLFLGILLMACTEEIDIEIAGNEPKLVVEALITDFEGPYYVRLTNSKLGLNSAGADFFDDNYEGVKDAQIIITDNTGISDTLIPAIKQLCYSYIYDETQNIIDSVIVDCDNLISYERGYYQTTGIRGIAENTYTLHINVNNKEYSAEAFMPEVPELDSLSFIVKKGEIGKFDLLVPLVYFWEPVESNYYLFQLSRPEDLVSGFSAYVSWKFSILSDEFLPRYVSGLNISAGSSPGNRDFIYRYQAEVNRYPIVSLTVSSLTEEAYLYYKSLIEQFNNDGGTYSPTPSSPKGNISGGALGFFRASALSTITDTSKIELPMGK